MYFMTLQPIKQQTLAQANEYEHECALCHAALLSYLQRSTRLLLVFECSAEVFCITN